MASGFSGGAQEFFCGGGYNGRRSMMIPVSNNTQMPYRSQHRQFSTIDPSSSMRKRPYPEMQNPNYLLRNYQQQGLNPDFFKSVKPRTSYCQTSPNRFLQTDLLESPDFSLMSSSSVSRFANLPIPPCNVKDPDVKLMDKLQELEKHLLGDDDEDQADNASVVTTREWSESIQNIICKPVQENCSAVVSSSPTSSTSSSSSVASSAQTNKCLFEAASFISDGYQEKAMEILSRASVLSDPKGKPKQRVESIVADALRWRIGIGSFVGESDPSGTMQVLSEVSPCFKVGLMAANQAILDATSDLPEKIHLIDFDGNGIVQYLNLIRSLEERGKGKPMALRITNVRSYSKSKPTFDEDKLRHLCKSVSLTVDSQTRDACSSNLTRFSLGCESDSAVVVNLPFHLSRIPDESVRTDNPRDSLLRSLKALKPRVLILIEQEMNGNTAPLAGRVAEVCSYYTSLFESLEFMMARGKDHDHPDRARLESGLGKKMSNSVGCEGAERVERCEMFGKWRARLRMAGFQARPMSKATAEAFQGRVKAIGSGFTVKEDNGGMGFGWIGRTLAVASAWS